MDVKVSRKETRTMPEGLVDVLVSNICDFYPVFDVSDPNLITDIEILTDSRQELLDRAMFAVMKQKGNDPVDPEDGIDWSDAIIGDVSVPLVIQQINSAVMKEGPGVKVTPETVRNGQNENVIFKVELTNAV